LTEQVADTPEPDRVHVVELKDPEPLLVQLMIPVGVLALPGAISVTNALHVAACPTWTGAGLQLTVIEDARL
jgi:hypothetical protein